MTRPWHERPSFFPAAAFVSLISTILLNLLLWRGMIALHRPVPLPRPASRPAFAVVLPPRRPPPPPPELRASAAPATPASPSSLLPALLLPSPVPLPSIPSAVEAGPFRILHPSGPSDLAPSKAPRPSSALILTEEMADEPPRLLSRTNPAYPAHAEASQIEGEVEIRLLVHPEGHVEQSEILQARPTGIFEASAQEAVRRWRFQPGIFRGRPAYVWIRQRLTFRLR